MTFLWNLCSQPQRWLSCSAKHHGLANKSFYLTLYRSTLSQYISSKSCLYCWTSNSNTFVQRDSDTLLYFTISHFVVQLSSNHKRLIPLPISLLLSLTYISALCVHYKMYSKMTHVAFCMSLEVEWVDSVDCIDWSPDGPGSSSKGSDKLTELQQSSAPNTVLYAFRWSYIKQIICLYNLNVVYTFDHHTKWLYNASNHLTRRTCKNVFASSLWYLRDPFCSFFASLGR